MKERRIRLLIADDHSVVRDGIRSVIESSAGYLVVGQATDGEQAVELARRHKPDIVLMDISMPKINGIQATMLMKRQNPGIRVVILTVHEDEEYVFQCLRAGASGYVLKNAGRKEILASLRSAMGGERFFSPSISNMIVDGFVRASHDSETTSGLTPPDPKKQLTKRETEVLQYIAQGYTNRKIAEALFLSMRTVNTHRTNLMQKLDIHDTAGLVRYAIEAGLVQLRP
jgi:DNA-binding NarL/FixJ family response regulator